MRLLIFSQYFFPEAAAAAQRIESFAHQLSKLGHNVTVICQTPNYPTGTVPAGYKNRLKQRSNEGGYTVVRTLTLPTRNVGIVGRLVNYSVFGISAFLAGLTEPRPDLVFVSSPPLFVGGSALLLSLIKQAPLVLDVRDIWPGVAMESGGVSKVFFLPMRLLEKLLYRRARIITTISEGMIELLLKENNLDRGKLKVIYNGIDLSRTAVGGKKPPLAKNRKFTVIYSGNIGTQQKIITVLEAAKILREDTGIRFLICGEGVEREAIEQKIRDWRLDNVSYLGLLSCEESLNLVESADVGLVPLTSNKYNDPALPSKVFDYCLAGIPILASAGSFLKKFIEENRIGFWVEPENAENLARKIEEISQMPREKLEDMGRLGHKLVEETYNRCVQAKKLERVLRDLVSAA